MKNIKLLILSMILLNMNFIFVNAEVKGAADIYKIRMHKLELCTGPVSYTHLRAHET